MNFHAQPHQPTHQHCNQCDALRRFEGPPANPTGRIVALMFSVLVVVLLVAVIVSTLMAVTGLTC